MSSHPNFKMIVGRVFLFVFLALTANGCATATKLEYAPEELRAAIRGGDLIEKGDRVLVKTATRGEFSLEVTEVDDKAIHGSDQVVPINDVVALEKLEFGTASKAVPIIASSVLIYGLVATVTMTIFLESLL